MMVRMCREVFKTLIKGCSRSESCGPGSWRPPQCRRLSEGEQASAQLVKRTYRSEACAVLQDASRASVVPPPNPTPRAQTRPTPPAPAEEKTAGAGHGQTVCEPGYQNPQYHGPPKHSSQESLSEAGSRDDGYGDNEETDSGDEDWRGNEGRAPIELLAEFLKAVMDRNYTLAKKLCQMILIYEPEKPEAKHFLPLIEEKLATEEATGGSSNEVNESDNEEADSEEANEDNYSDDTDISDSDEYSDSSSTS
ncbi:glutamate-rich protein 2 isoform X2 [Brachyhypopomus gauderio]|uniref:glutamate-rich protein 2 isoform X2 n=2 Tax=Brachyhypopomus gauderio TaxID=698409 RepID=UPI004040F400